MTELVRFAELRTRSSSEILDQAFFDRRFKLIADALNGVGVDVDALKVTSNTLVQLGLDRINSLLGPALTRLQSAAELGFLTATSSTSATLTVGQTLTLAIDAGASRDLFTPTPFLSVLRANPGAQNDWAIARLDTYNRDNGGLSITILATNGTVASAPHSDWIVAASSGIVPFLADSLATVQSEIADAQSLLSSLEALSAAFEAGPVASVNGKTGAVVIGMSDIADLITTLGGKADTTHGHAIANVSGLQNALDAKADAGAMTTALAGKTSAADVTSAIAAASINSDKVLATFNDRTNASETLSSADYGKVVTFASGSATTVTLPNSLPKGFNCLWYQGGAGQLTFSAASGATLRQRQAKYKSAGQYAAGSLVVVSNSGGSSAVYALSGDVSS